jgi:branched-chain amino acid transport system permease protein
VTSNEVMQQVISGVVDGSTFAVLGASYALITGVTKRFHVAYVTSYVGGVYAAIWSNDHLPLPHAGDVLFGLLIAALIGVVIEIVIYRRIAARAARRGGDQLIPVFIASLGLTIVVQNVISWGWNTQPLSFNLIENKGWAFGDLRFTKLQVYAVIVYWILLVVLWAYLRHTRQGARITGVQVNPQMAQVVGINTKRIFILVFAIGSALAGLLGMVEATTVAAAPQMGFNAVFYGFVVAFVAGMDRGPLRIGIVGLIVGLLQSLSVLWLDLQYAPAVVFSVLLIYLIFLPINFRRIFARRRPPAAAA